MTFSRDKLAVRVYPDRVEAGAAGAQIASAIVAETIAREGKAAVVFASAVSQDPFLAAFREQPIDWPRVTAFHMDEYAGMAPDHPASFRRFLRDRLFDHVPVAAFHQLDAEAADPDAECERYAALLRDAR
ncbi:MAG TPA: 6-phosphogluconolactonase, partial [Candidatus Solibacter sp.]